MILSFKRFYGIGIVPYGKGLKVVLPLFLKAQNAHGV
jgi:hypothetical protein